QLPFGALADRWDRRWVLIAADVGRMAVLAVVTVSVMLEFATLPLLVTAVFIEGALTVLGAAAEPAAVQNLVPPQQFPQALAQQEVRERGAALLGQPVGGALFALGRAVPFLFDALSYLASLAALLLIRRPLQGPREHKPASNGVFEGTKWLWSRPFFRDTSLLVAGSNLVFQALTLALIVAATERGASPFLVGVIVAGSGVGGVLGAMVAARIGRRLSLTGVVLATHWIWVALLPLFPLIQNPVFYAVVYAAVGFVGPWWNVNLVAARVNATPDHLQGRVTTASKLNSFGAIPLGSLLGGLALQALGTTWTMAGLAGLMLVFTILATISPAIRAGA
ncbi:MAG TPA: MFS transporter, partial [Candidatus Limnocylindrales bacterium]